MEDQCRLRIFGAAHDLRGGRQAICRDRVGPQHRGQKQTRQHPGAQGAAQRDRALCLWLMRPAFSVGLFGICWGATGYSSLLSGWLCRDGVTVTFPYLPGGLDDFVEHVIPSYSAAACFSATTKGRRCANSSACRARRIASFPIECLERAEEVRARRPLDVCLIVPRYP